MKRRIADMLVSVAAVCAMVVSIVSPDMAVTGTAAGRSIRLNKSRVTITKGRTFTLKVKIKPARLKSKVTFSTSKKKVAKVNKKGVISAVGTGSAKITARVKGTALKAVCKVTVKKAKDKTDVKVTNAPAATDVPATSVPTVTPAQGTPPATATPAYADITAIKIDEDDYMEIEIGESYDLKTEIAPAGCKDVTYTSDRDYVASVDGNGRVTAKFLGMTTITVASKRNPDVKDSIHIYAVDRSVPEDGFNKTNDAVKHGTLETITFKSDYTESGSQQARVWLPHDYSTDKQYNVLYCLHGGGANMWYWCNGGTQDYGCAADRILDNLYAEGLMEPAIVVFPNGIMPYDKNKVYPEVPEHMEVNPFAGSTDWFLTEYEVIYNLMPYMKEHYSINEGKDHTAVCGLSMGGGQTLQLGLGHSDIFGYVGCFSACPFAEKAQTFVTSEEDAVKLNNNLKLFTMMVGSEDGLANSKSDSKSKAFAEVCRDNGLNFTFIEEPGLAHEDKCWDRNLYKFMKYAFK